MSEEPVQEHHARGRRASVVLGDDLANQVAGVSVHDAVVPKKPGLMKRHNRWIARRGVRERVAHRGITVGLLAAAVVAVSSGGAAGVATAMAFTLLFCLSCVTFSPWGARVRPRRYRVRTKADRR